MSVMASEIAKFLGTELHGVDLTVKEPRAAHGPDYDWGVSYVATASFMARPRRALYILPPEFGYSETHLHVPNPRLAFIKVVNKFLAAFSGETLRRYGVVGNDAIRPWGVSRSPIVGVGSIIREGARVEACVEMGAGCLVQSGTVIGQEGFGFEKDENGVPLRFPHIGRVIMGNGVEIGPNNVVCRGALTDTIIEDNVKTDGLVHIGHGCVIGANTMIAATAKLCGSVTVGMGCWIAPGVVVMDHLTVGYGAYLGLGAVVIKDVEPHAVMVGNPARRLRARGEKE